MLCKKVNVDFYVFVASA